MAFIEVVDVTYRKFSGWQEPQFPSGYWQGSARVIGDATGGDMSGQINFSRVTEPFNSQYYSWEELMVTTDEEATVPLGILIANFGLVTPVTGRRYTMFVTGDNSGNASVEGVQMGLLPIFLGQQASANSAVSITIIRNNDNLDVMDILIGGYVWDVRSTSVPGGPQRPPTGLYRL